MSAKKRGLGRGLDALLGAAREPAPVSAPESPDGPLPDATVDDLNAVNEPIARLPVDLIRRGRYQPRREFDQDSLKELADSIAAQGVIQPVVVRPAEDGRYELIAGERRWRAAQLAGLSDIPVVVRDVDEQSAIAIGLIENIQRDDLNPLEEAFAFQRLGQEFDLTHQLIADAVGKSRTTVTNLLRLLELNDDVKVLVQQSRLEMGHARALLGLKGSQQSEIARQVVTRGLSVRETEKLVRRIQLEDAMDKSSRRPETTDPNIRRLQDDLTDRLGARVSLQQGAKGAGKLVIAYGSLDELDGILAHIK